MGWFLIFAKIYFSRILGERICILVLSLYQIETGPFYFFSTFNINYLRKEGLDYVFYLQGCS